MKKILLITLLSLFSAYCQEDEEPNTFVFPTIAETEQQPTVESLTAEARININNLPALYAKFYPGSDIKDLEFFFTIPLAHTFKNKVEHLPVPDKNRLLQEVAKIFTPSERWPSKRNFLTLIIDAGANVNTSILAGNETPSTFLGESVINNDFQGVQFAIDHKANIFNKRGNLYPLMLAKDIRIARLLLEHNALEPFKGDQNLQLQLLLLYTQPAYPYQLLKLYKDRDLRIPSSNGILLNNLCYGADKTTSQQFFEKFLILYKAGAVDLIARSSSGKTALEIIKGKDQNNPTVKLARKLLEDLEKNPELWQSQIKSVQQAQANLL